MTWHGLQVLRIVQVQHLRDAKKIDLSVKSCWDELACLGQHGTDAAI